MEVGVTSGTADRTGLKRIVPQPVPDGLDYDFWLGPAPDRPYVPERVARPHWYHISDHSLGFIAGWGIHHIDTAQWGKGADGTGPVEVEGTAVFPTKEQDVLCDNTLAWNINYRYADGVELSFTGSDPGTPPGNREGATFIGDQGRIWVTRGRIESEPASILEEPLGESDERLYVSDHHQQNLLDCIRSGRDTVCPIEAACSSELVCQIGWIAVYEGRKLRWDPEKEEFVGDAAANRRLRRDLRAPWSLA
jgi:predicted dehydrogenase